jgi:hypothetical protein
MTPEEVCNACIVRFADSSVARDGISTQGYTVLKAHNSEHEESYISVIMFVL